MFYEEKLIAGLMYCRTTPDGEWKLPSQAQLSEKYSEVKQELSKVNYYLSKYQECINSIEDSIEYYYTNKSGSDIRNIVMGKIDELTKFIIEKDN